MNKLNLNNINLHAPYEVHEREDRQHEFYFWSDYGIEFDISFVPNNSIVPSGAYVFLSSGSTPISIEAITS